MDIDRRRASMDVTGLLAQDQTTQGQAFTHYPGQQFPGYGVPAYLDFHVTWADIIDQYTIRDPERDYAAQFVQTRAKVTWSAVQNATVQVGSDGRFTGFGADPYRFEADPSTETNFAAVGRERNGWFYP